MAEQKKDSTWQLHYWHHDNRNTEASYEERKHKMYAQGEAELDRQPVSPHPTC